MKHDRRRICLSNNILYEWDKYTIQWVEDRKEGPKQVDWFWPTSTYETYISSPTISINQENGLISFTAPDSKNLEDYWIPVSIRRPIPVGRTDNLKVCYKGTPVLDHYYLAQSTGYDGQIITMGFGVEYKNVPFQCFAKQAKSEYVETVSDYNIGAYPDNGVQDGYWYVRRAK